MIMGDDRRLPEPEVLDEAISIILGMKSYYRRPNNTFINIKSIPEI